MQLFCCSSKRRGRSARTSVENPQHIQSLQDFLYNSPDSASPVFNSLPILSARSSFPQKPSIAIKHGSIFKPQDSKNCSLNVSSVKSLSRKNSFTPEDPLISPRDFQRLFSNDTKNSTRISWSNKFGGNDPRPKFQNPFVQDGNKQLPKIKPITPFRQNKGCFAIRSTPKITPITPLREKVPNQPQIQEDLSFFDQSSDSLVKL